MLMIYRLKWLRELNLAKEVSFLDTRYVMFKYFS
jgi:hypothetical protein